ncbi:MAG: hypothetical protein ACMXYD_00440 [Candidatus Woesearchaeota archaeon]
MQALQNILSLVYAHSKHEIIRPHTQILSLLHAEKYSVRKAVLSASCVDEDMRIPLEELADTFYEQEGLLIARGFISTQQYFSSLLSAHISAKQKGSLRIDKYTRPVLLGVSPVFLQLVHDEQVVFHASYKQQV